MIEIIAGQYKFDVTNDVGIPLTYQIDDIKDIGSRNTSFSKTITLPGTDNNNKLFGMFFSPQKFIDKNLSLSQPDANVGTYFNPNISTDIQLFKDGMQIFTGTMKLLQVNKTEGVFEYEVALFGELGGLYFAIKNFNGKRLRLEDLGWNPTTLDDYNDSTIFDSFYRIGVVGNEEVVYPYINYANQISPDIEVRNYRPAYPLFGAFKKMFTKLGYTITGGWFDTDAMQNSIFIPNNNEKLLMYTNKFINDTPLNGNYNIATTSALKMSGVGLSTDISFNSTNCEYTYTGTKDITLNFNTSYNFDFSGGGINTTINFTLLMVLNGSSFIASNSNVWTSGNTKHINLSINKNVNLVTNDKISFLLFISSNVTGGSITTSNVNGGIIALATEFTTTEQVYNQPIDYDLNCPRNVYMDELFTSFCKLFNLYVTESKYNKKELNIRPYIEFYSGNTTLNWSDKFDKDNYKILPISEITPNIYNFKWKPDKDYLNDKYDKQYGQTMADYIETSGFESAKGEEKIELMFSPSHIYGIGGDDKVTTGIFKRDTGGDLPINSNIRLVFLKNVDCSAYTLFDGAIAISGGIGNYCYAGMTDDPFNGGFLASGDRLNLGFASPAEVYYDLPSGSGVSTSFYSIYWSPYIGEMIDSSNLMLNCRLNLDTVDLFRLNFANYINIHGIDYKLNAIKDIDVNQNEMAQVELIKVVDYIY